MKPCHMLMIWWLHQMTQNRLSRVITSSNWEEQGHYIIILGMITIVKSMTIYVSEEKYWMFLINFMLVFEPDDHLEIDFWSSIHYWWIVMDTKIIKVWSICSCLYCLHLGLFQEIDTLKGSHEIERGTSIRRWKRSFLMIFHLH